jgi:hypothetical protein
LIYTNIYRQNADFVSTFSGSPSYGEITENGVEALIQGINTYFLHLMTHQERRNFRLIDNGAGLATSIMNLL